MQADMKQRETATTIIMPEETLKSGTWLTSLEAWMVLSSSWGKFVESKASSLVSS